MSTYSLKIVSGPASGRELPAAAALEIGRDPAAGLSLPDDELVSHRHARIDPTAEGLVLEDLGSRNGTFVNGTRVEAPTLLSPGDRVVIGETAIEVGLVEPARECLLLVSSHGGPAYEVALTGPLEVGRDPAAGLPLPDDGQVSWRHVRLVPRSDGIEVEDLESTNGTFVDGLRIAGTTVVHAGCRLSVGETAIEVAARARADTAAAPGFLSADTVASGPAPLPQVVLEVVGPDGSSRQLPLSVPLEVGRDPAAGLVLDDQLVSRLHARLTPGAGQVTIEDLGSRNGTFVNGAPIDAAIVAEPGDRVVVGKTTIVVGVVAGAASGARTSMQAALTPEASAGLPEPAVPAFVVQVIEGWAAGRQFRLTGPLEVGRDPAADVPLVDDDGVSHRHARLTPNAEGAVVEDLGSSDGTFVNDQRIDEPTPVAAGDRIRVGGTVLRLRPADG